MAILNQLKNLLKSTPFSSQFSNHNAVNERKLFEICSLSEEEAIKKMNTSTTGLNFEELEKRLEEFGANNLAYEKKHGFVLEILLRLKNPLVIQLLVICVVSYLMDDVRSAIVVGGMIFISVFVSYFQEKKSDKAVEKLRNLVQAITTVVREGKEHVISMSEVLPGDIVLLSAGSIVPADLRIIQAKDFFVSQSILTGESIPLEKSFEKVTDTKKQMFELNNACFQGSNVISGSAKGLVVNTGLKTFLGSLSVNLTAPKSVTSFDKGVQSFVWLMVRFMLVMVTATFLIVGLTKEDHWADALLFALSVAVGLTPEMLPMIITVSLSKGAIAMSRKKVIVKKLSAIQNLGAMNILCTDKTGTLTQDKIILEKHVDVTNRESEDVLRYAYMNSYYQTGLKNLLDLAILSFEEEELDVEKSCRKVDEIPFDFIRKRMSVIIDYEENHVLICKGAVEEVYNCCNRYQVDDDIYPLFDMIKNHLMTDYEELSSDGYRVLAIAYREFHKEKEVFSVADEKELILLGYVAFLDPPKDSAEKAIQALKDYGVRVKVLTGDNELVTRKICKDVGFHIDKVVTGKQLKEMSEDEYKRVVHEEDAFAHLTPQQKENIILTLKESGNVVGFLGDGINDAPAMKVADVGISVDTAIDIAKESADIILLEKSLLVLEDGIIEGRKLFNNIIKYIKMGSSSNFGNMFSVVGGAYFLPFLPMAPIQILLNNLLYDVSQTGIPLDNVDEEFVKKPQKWDISYIKKFMVWIGPISSIFDYATFFLMLYFFNCILFTSENTSAPMKEYYEKLFHTGWFVESLLTQTLIVHIIRTNNLPFIQSRASISLIFTTLVIMGFGIYLPYSSFADFFGFVALPMSYWIWISGFLFSYGVLAHLTKTWFNKKNEMTSVNS